VRPMRCLLIAVVLVVACAAVAAPAGAAQAATARSPQAAMALPSRAATAHSPAAAPNARRDWFFIPHGAHVRPGFPADAVRLARRYSALWIGPRHAKVIYLTFDEGWEAGTTRRIVGILDRAHVRASFFVTGQYMRANPSIVRLLVKHGYLVCNHSYSHPYMTGLAGRPQAFARQLRDTESAYHAATGGRLARVFRPPYGAYSARVLQLIQRLGYTTVFWSYTGVDYNEHAQPPASVTRARVLAASYPGSLLLLHASSRSNTAALAGILHTLKQRGYSFATVDTLKP
jgi:peptidoglycan-N-acetylmuramic acid deacetylase